MKIALLPGVFFPQPGGAQVQTHNLANKLVKLGHQVDVYLLNKTNLKNNLYNIIVINRFFLSLFFYLYLYLRIDLSFIFKIFFLIFLRKKNYDIFHFQLLNFKMLYILKILKNLNQKVVVTFQGIDIQVDKTINYGYRLDQRYNKIFLENIYKIDYFFSISFNITQDLLNLGINQNKIVLIPNAVEKEKFLIYQNLKDDISNKLNLVTVARFAESKKGFDLIPEIARILKKNNINFNWSIIGFNSRKIGELPYMEEYKKNFNFFENIQNLDEDFFPHSQLIKILKKNHIYINLARVESFGISIIEALASKLPVITFDTKGGNELIKNDLNGIIVQDYEPAQMAAAIMNYKDNQLYERHRSNTLKSIEKFTLLSVAKKTIEKYDETKN
tara:strand:- start:942 stop:2102 length:1161 start_codon:yes stop_codon:yes gene_type:complete